VIDIINESVYRSYQDIRSKLTHALVQELGDNLPTILAMEVRNEKRSIPMWDIPLLDKWRDWVNLN